MFRSGCLVALLALAQCSSVESAESSAVVVVGDDQSVRVDPGGPGCYRDLYLEPPSADWTFEVGLEGFESAVGVGTWKYRDGDVDVYLPGRVTGQLVGLEFSSLADDPERNFYNFAVARVDDGSLVLVKEVAIEDVRDPDEGIWCPLELRLRGFSSEEEQLFLNGFVAIEDM